MATHQAATLMGVSTASVNRAKAIKRDHPELHEAMKRGDKEAVKATFVR